MSEEAWFPRERIKIVFAIPLIPNIISHKMSEVGLIINIRNSKN